MTLPRQVLPGSFYMVTRRCTQQQFLLRPDPETNNAVLYCLALASERTKVGVILPSVMSNHHHTATHDPEARLSEFMEHFHKLAAKCINVLRGRGENVFSSDPPTPVRMLSRRDVMLQCVYAAINPVKHRLVERVADWPGINGLAALLANRELRAVRPAFFFCPDGPMPKTISLNLTIPAELGDADTFRAELKERVERAEAGHARLRERRGYSVVGRNRVLRQSWKDVPKKPQAPVQRRKKIRPRFAAKELSRRLKAIQEHRDFQRAYRKAWAALRTETPLPFPPGTYWLRRHLNVPIMADSENSN